MRHGEPTGLQRKTERRGGVHDERVIEMIKQVTLWYQYNCTIAPGKNMVKEILLIHHCPWFLRAPPFQFSTNTLSKIQCPESNHNAPFSRCPVSYLADHLIALFLAFCPSEVAVTYSLFMLGQIARFSLFLLSEWKGWMLICRPGEEIVIVTTRRIRS